jgi:hypothetical protein
MGLYHGMLTVVSEIEVNQKKYKTKPNMDLFCLLGKLTLKRTNFLTFI